MRLRNKKTYYLKTKTTITDSEGGKYQGYSDIPVEIKACIYPAGGKLQAEIYGERLNYILNMLYDGTIKPVMKDNILHYQSEDGTIDFCEGNGICVNVPSTSDPDYKIISIKLYGHLFMELEKI
jgi:hypothetical protein